MFYTGIGINSFIYDLRIHYTMFLLYISVWSNNNDHILCHDSDAGIFIFLPLILLDTDIFKSFFSDWLVLLLYCIWLVSFVTFLQPDCSFNMLLFYIWLVRFWLHYIWLVGFVTALHLIGQICDCCTIWLVKIVTALHLIGQLCYYFTIWLITYLDLLKTVTS